MITLPVHQLPCQENKSLVVSFAWAIYLQKEELVLPRSLLVIAAGSARAVCSAAGLQGFASCRSD